MSCKCASRSTFRDDVTGNLFCSQCYCILEFDNFDAQIGGIKGPTGTNIYIGHAGSGSYYSYKDRKLLEAKRLIREFLQTLELTHLEIDVVSMIDEVTQGEFGLGEWLQVLIGACVYIVLRKGNKFLPMEEISEAVQCDVYELGRMISRVVDFLNLDMPEFSVAILVEREIGRLPSFGQVDDDVKDRMKKQGIFLVNCTVKWFLTTGRRPLPLVAAVIVFVAQLNEVKGLKIENVAKEVRAKVSTSKLRYKELLEALVNVAQVLPWGKDVTVKNVVRHAPFIIQYMERKSMEKRGKGTIMLESGGKDLGGAVSECLRTDDVHKDDGNFAEGDSQFSGEGHRTDSPRMDSGDTDKRSNECLSMAYAEFSYKGDHDELLENSENDHENESWGGYDLIDGTDWWTGKSELSKKLLVKQILEKDVGMSAMPPSFVAGIVADERRRRKINAAKVRINKIMHPSNAKADDNGSSQVSEHVSHGKKRKRKGANDIDWEDLIIETLLLHRVKEEEIEKGHYKTLMDLYVFNSGVI